ncbi:MAG: hypothetical protein HFACDABA_00570 [Anaerolineales bacterium]|nr:hypothetical protein [Anaerolineales bacterium]
MTRESSWLDGLLARLPSTGEAGEAALRALRERRVRIRVRRQSSGARWTLFGNIELNPMYVEGREDAYALSLLVHEVHHLKQGWHLALSVQGELEAWQIQFAYLKSLTGAYSSHPQHNAVIAELMSLSPSDRGHLRRARALMQQFAGKKYRIDLLPLFPLAAEIRNWAKGKAPTTDDK